MAETRQYCTFYVNKLYFGVDVKRVQEVIRYQQMTRVPLAPNAIEGLINLRGQIVTAIDLRCHFGMPARADEYLPMNVVVRDGENAVSFLVDKIGDVVEVENSLFEPPPNTVHPSVRNLIHGTYKLPDRLLLAMDTERVLHEFDSRVNGDGRVAG